MKKILIVILLALLFNFAFATQTLAQDTLLGNMACIDDGSCTAEDIRDIVINLAAIILAVTGSLSLLAFVIGGIMFLVSSGSNETVAQAKKIITGAIIGMVVVFTSYTIIMFILRIFGITDINLSIIG